MADVKIRVDGIDDVKRALDGQRDALRQALLAIVLAGAEVIRSAAESMAPGRIAGDMLKEPAERSGTKVLVNIGPHKRRWYAQIVEKGAVAHPVAPRRKKALRLADNTLRRSAQHPGTRARPFLRPAFDGNQDNAQTAMGDQVKVTLGL